MRRIRLAPAGESIPPLRGACFLPSAGPSAAPSLTRGTPPSWAPYPRSLPSRVGGAGALPTPGTMSRVFCTSNHSMGTLAALTNAAASGSRVAASAVPAASSRAQTEPPSARPSPRAAERMLSHRRHPCGVSLPRSSRETAVDRRSVGTSAWCASSHVSSGPSPMACCTRAATSVASGASGPSCAACTRCSSSCPSRSGTSGESEGSARSTCLLYTSPSPRDRG